MAEQYEVVVTSRAEKSLEKIVLYLEEEVSSHTAEKIKTGLISEINKLAHRPEKNSIQKEISSESIIFRRVIKWSYRIIYIIEETDRMVFVMEIDHIRMNPERLRDLL